MAGEAVLGALRHVWLVLKSAGVPAAVISGIAMAAWKYVRATNVVDLLIAVDDDQVEGLLGELSEAAIRPKCDPPLVSLGRLSVIPLLYEPPETFADVQIDLLIGKSAYHQTALQRRLATRLPDLDVEIDVLACEDVILHKLSAGRIIDRADAAALLRANRERLDFGYLARWADELGVAEGLTEAWSEAFPGEPPPG